MRNVRVDTHKWHRRNNSHHTTIHDIHIQLHASSSADIQKKYWKNNNIHTQATLSALSGLEMEIGWPIQARIIMCATQRYRLTKHNINSFEIVCYVVRLKGQVPLKFLGTIEKLRFRRSAALMLSD